MPKKTKRGKKRRTLKGGSWFGKPKQTEAEQWEVFDKQQAQMYPTVKVVNPQSQSQANPIPQVTPFRIVY